MILDAEGNYWVTGRVSGKRRQGDQCPGMPEAICHACGLGYQCRDEDCPNDKLNPIPGMRRPVNQSELESP